MCLGLTSALWKNVLKQSTLPFKVMFINLVLGPDSGAAGQGFTEVDGGKTAPRGPGQ